MGILSKILSGETTTEQNNFSSVQPATTIDNGTQPVLPCPAGHNRFWRDCYGDWHCYDCRPPIAAAMVREELTLGRSRENNFPNSSDLPTTPQQNNFSSPLTEGFRIIAIQKPAGEIFFEPTSTQAERREAIDNLEWFDRVDARRQHIAGEPDPK